MAKSTETVLVEDKMLRTKKRFSLTTYEKYMKNSKYHGAQRFVITEDPAPLESKSPDPAPKKKGRVKSVEVNKPEQTTEESASERFLREHNEQKMKLQQAEESDVNEESSDGENQSNQSEGGEK